MPRLSPELIEKREKFVREFFEKNPTATATAANEAVKQEYKMKMAPPRVSEIRTEVLGKETTTQTNGKQPIRYRTPEGQEGSTATNLAAAAAPTTTDSSIELEGALERAKQILISAGLSNIEISFDRPVRNVYKA